MATILPPSPSLLLSHPRLPFSPRIRSAGGSNTSIYYAALDGYSARAGVGVQAIARIGSEGVCHVKPHPKVRRLKRLCQASVGQASSSTEGSQVYDGVYGEWSVDTSDIREVLLYRAGLVITAATFVVAASAVFLPDDTAFKSAIVSSSDLFYAIGAGGLGLSLFLIHIYVASLKRALQFLWAAGVLGSLGVFFGYSASANQGLAQYVYDHPSFIWAVGPLFASLTGLVFKEGLCYGKLEAAALFFTIPSLLLGHLAGFLDENAEKALLTLWMGLFTVFAVRKFSQPIKDDIGDKSVFMFNALPEDEKKALLVRIRDQAPKADGKV